MAENIQRNKGRPGNYKFSKGGAPDEMGPFIGIVVNNVDTTRSGRLQVYIEQFGSDQKDGTPDTSDKSLWRTVSYCPPFYGATPVPTGGNSSSVGEYPGNNNSYGMWFTPPDVGVSVLCFFVGGDPSQGYYVGCIPQNGVNRMVPAIGAVPENQRKEANKTQDSYFANAPLLPVTEINTNNSKESDSSKFYDQPKPVHSYVAAVLFNQGLSNDSVRGPITSSGQRESPSNCYGISTPGRPIYQGGYKDKNLTKSVSNAQTSSIDIIGRRGGHTFVMDDGATEGNDNLVRIRSSNGHQILMSDDSHCFYFIHSNGQTWLEFGQEGTVDIFSTNSVNVRTQGTINLHADKDINMFAGGDINMRSMKGVVIQSEKDIGLASQGEISVLGTAKVEVMSNGAIALKSNTGGWNSGGELNLKAGTINLNGASPPSTSPPKPLTEYIMPDTKFDSQKGWISNPKGLQSICTRAPTHEPYPYHNQGVQEGNSAEPGQPSTPPGAPKMPGGWSISKQ
jgi:hypothetical protein